MTMMTEKEYRAHPAISRSELFEMSKSPEKFKYYKENPKPPTESLVLGQLFHTLVLQPENFEKEYIVMHNVDRRTKIGKQIYAEFLEQSKEKTVVNEDMLETAKAMCSSVLSNEYVKKLLKGKAEVALFWTDELTGEECKIRVDMLTDLGEFIAIVDFKSAADAETEAFMRSAIKYGYDLQSGQYTEGVEKQGYKKPTVFVFVVVEKEPPYSVNILQADELFIRRGKDLFREYIGIYHDCKTTGEWYGYLGKFNQINNLSLPAWLAKEVE